MQDNDRRTKQYRFVSDKAFVYPRESPPLFQIGERRSDDWVGELQAILQIQESQLRISGMKKIKSDS
jgi:hypothetical protein